MCERGGVFKSVQPDGLSSTLSASGHNVRCSVVVVVVEFDTPTVCFTQTAQLFSGEAY